MIELRNDRLMFKFPEVHPAAELTIEMQRTLRIPDDGKIYPLPPGLGRFPLRHVDDYSAQVSDCWRRRGGVMMPMYQSEALWLNLHSRYVDRNDAPYPFAIKVATGKINAVTGDDWQDPLSKRKQDYVVAPQQPWIDGYCVEKGSIRQFVAMPLGAGYSVEEQVTGEAEFGGIQLIAYPMKREVFEKRFPPVAPSRIRAARFGLMEQVDSLCADADMGLAPGGKMRQEIYDDPFEFDDWDHKISSRCFVHLTNSLVWHSITGADPPHPPFTAAEYTRYGMPWFEYYSENLSAVDGSKHLDDLKSVKQIGDETGQCPLPENESTKPENIKVVTGKVSPHQVREGSF